MWRISNLDSFMKHHKRFLDHSPQVYVSAFLIQRHYHLFEKGLDGTHFDVLLDHFTACLHRMWVEENVIEALGRH